MQIALRTKILIYSFFIVFTSVLTSGLIMVYSVSSAFEKELGQRALSISRTVAQLAEIKENVGKMNGHKTIQPIAERIRLATNVDYVVVFDMNRIRYSHPSEDKIGSAFEGGDENASLSEHEYLSKAYGVLGSAIRAFVPVMDEEGVRQVGVVVVGVLTPTIQNVLYQFQYDILLSLVWGLVIGLLGSWLLANNIKKQMLGMEPYEISKLLEERSAVMQALDTGIVAVDDQGKISFMNRLAQEYAGIEQINISYEYSLHKLFPELWQFMIQNRGIETVNKTMLLKGKMYLTTIHPIYVKETFVGTVLILTNRTEANRLAEELTGVKNLVDALRAQNHEYMNKLHSIAGLIQLDRTEEALDKIIDETSDEQDVIQYFKDHISVYSISGLLLGKRSRAHELGVQLTIDRTSYLTDIIEGLHSGDLITLIGNVIENALEACIDSGENKQVTCIIQGNEHFFLIEVKDTGVGITESERVKMFDYGFSTKAKEGRGIGLALVKQIVDAQEGEMEVSSKIGEGTKIKILLGGETNEANQGFYYRR